MIKLKIKILAVILLIMTLINIIQPTVLAANQGISGSGADDFIARQYSTKIRTTDEGNDTENGIIARRLLPKSKGWNFNNGDGILVFCVQNHVPLKTGEYYAGTYTQPTAEDMRKAGKVAYFGWYQEKGNYGADGYLENPELKQYAFCQQMIWETLGQSSATFVDGNIQNEYETFKNQVNEQNADKT